MSVFEFQKCVALFGIKQLQRRPFVDAGIIEFAVANKSDCHVFHSAENSARSDFDGKRELSKCRLVQQLRTTGDAHVERAATVSARDHDGAACVEDVHRATAGTARNGLRLQAGQRSDNLRPSAGRLRFGRSGPGIIRPGSR